MRRTHTLAWFFAISLLLTSAAGTARASDLESRWEAFRDTTRRQIDRIDRKMEPLREKLADMGKEADEEWKKAVNDFQKIKADIAEDVARLKEKSGDAWKRGKAGVDAALEKLEQKYRELKAGMQ